MKFAKSSSSHCQVVKTTESDGPRGFLAGKNVKGRKRHALVDTDGRLLVAQSHSTSVKDRDGAVPLRRASRDSFPFVEIVFADAAYARKRVANATRIPVEIVRKLADQVSFVLLPQRSVVEKTFAWRKRNRGLAKTTRPLSLQQ